MADKHLCVAIYVTHDQADEAFWRFQAEGSNLDLLSFVGRDYWKDMMGSRNSGKRFLYRGSCGSFWEELWSVLRGWGVFSFFENGPVLVAGPLVRTIIATQEQNGSVHSGSDFEAARSGLGIPKESIVEYEKALLNDHILAFVQGSLKEIDKVQCILNETEVINQSIHHNNAT